MEIAHKIAHKMLSDTQRIAILSRPRGYSDDHCYTWHLGTFNRLRRLGLAEAIGNNAVLRLTPLGLEVRGLLDSAQ